MDLKHYLQILWRRRWVILVTVVATVVVAAIVQSIIKPRYEATTVLRIGTAAGGQPDWVDYSLDYSTRLMNTYSELATSPAMQDKVMEKLGLSEPPLISIQTPSNSEMFIITAEHADAAAAAQAANSVAEFLIEENRSFAAQSTEQFQDVLATQLEKLRAQLDETPSADATPNAGESTVGDLEQQRRDAYNNIWQQYNQAGMREALQAQAMVVVSPADTPVAPSSPNWKKNLALALFVGLAGSLGLILLLENLDTTIYQPDQTSAISLLPLLGTIPNMKQKQNVKLVSHNSLEEDAFRRLRTHLAVSSPAPSCSALMVTSPETGDGKSTIAANLALSMAQAGYSVVLVDCDLRMPALHRLFDVPNEVGLSTVLEEKSTLAEALQHDQSTGVTILTAGPQPDKPAELIASPQMVDVVNQLEQQFDQVLMDVPALLAVADGSILAQMMHQVLLVVQSGYTRKEAAQAAYQQLTLVKAPLTGVVMNRVPTNPAKYRKYYRMPVG